MTNASILSILAHATPTPTSWSKGQKSKSRGGGILWRPPSRTACCCCFFLERLFVRDSSTEDVHTVEFYLYPTVGTVLIHSIKPELTE